MSRYFLVAMIFCFLVPTPALANWDHFEIILNGGGETVARGLQQLALFFSDSLVARFVVALFAGGILIGVATELYRGFVTGQFSFARAVGIAIFGLIVFRSFVEPTAVITVRDDVLNRDTTISGVPLFIALPAKAVNLIEQGFVTIFYTASADPKLNYLAKAHGATFGVLHQALQNIGQLDDPYAQKSLESFFADCVKYVANFPASTYGPEELNSDLVEQVFAEAGSHPSLFTTYYSNANKAGISMSCQQSWNSLSPILGNTNSYTAAWEKTCGTGFGHGISAMAECKGSINQLLGLFEPSYTSDVLAKRIVLANVKDRALRFGWGFSAELASKVQTEGLGMMASMNAYLFDMRYMLYVLCIGLMSFLVFLLPTPAFGSAMTAVFYLWGWLLMWSIADAITFRISVDKMADVLVSIKHSGMGIEQLIYTPGQVEKSLGMAGFVRTLSMTVSSILMGFIFKKANPAVSGMFGAVSGWVAGKGAEAARSTMTPEGMEQNLKSTITPVTTMANAGVSLQALNYGTTGFEINKMSGGAATMNEGGGNPVTALRNQTSLSEYQLGKQHGEHELAQSGNTTALNNRDLGRLAAQGTGVKLGSETGATWIGGGTTPDNAIRKDEIMNTSTDLGQNFSASATQSLTQSLAENYSRAQSSQISAANELAALSSSAYQNSSSYLSSVAQTSGSTTKEASSAMEQIKALESRQESLAQKLSRDTGISLDTSRAVVSHLSASGEAGVKGSLGWDTPGIIAFFGGARGGVETTISGKAGTGIALNDQEAHSIRQALSNQTTADEIKSIARSREQVIGYSTEIANQQGDTTSQTHANQQSATLQQAESATRRFSEASADVTTYSQAYAAAQTQGSTYNANLNNEVFKQLSRTVGSEPLARQIIQKANDNLFSPEAKQLQTMIDHTAKQYADALGSINRPAQAPTQFGQAPENNIAHQNNQQQHPQHITDHHARQQAGITTLSAPPLPTINNLVPQQGSIVNHGEMQQHKATILNDQQSARAQTEEYHNQSKLTVASSAITGTIASGIQTGATLARTNVAEQIATNLERGGIKTNTRSTEAAAEPLQKSNDTSWPRAQAATSTEAMSSTSSPTPAGSSGETNRAPSLQTGTAGNPVALLTPQMDGTVEGIAQRIAGGTPAQAMSGSAPVLTDSSATTKRDETKPPVKSLQ